MDGQAPVEGWYTDPADPSRYRYWDGAGWTTRVRTPGSTTPSSARGFAPVVEPEPEPIAATDPAIDALFADPDPAPTDETSDRRAARGGARQRFVVTVAVIALAAVGLTAALTFTGGDGTAGSSAESSESFDTAAALDNCIARLREELPGNESEVEWEPADTVDHQQVGNQVHVAFWGFDPDEDPGQRRANFLCVLNGGDLSSVARLYLRFDDFPLEARDRSSSSR